VGNVLGDDEEVVEAVFFFQLGEIGKHFAHELHGLTMDSKAILEFVVLLCHQGMVFRGQNPGGEDRDFFMFGQQGHGGQRRFGTNRPADNKIGFFVQDQLFDS